MSRAKLKVGDDVLVKVNPQQNNGAPHAPAKVVRVLDGEEDRVNVKVFLDGDENLLLRNVEVLSKEPKEGDENVPTKYAVRS